MVYGCDTARSAVAPWLGSQDHPFGPYSGEIPPRPEPPPAEPTAQDAVLVPADQVRTLLAALIIAADDQRTAPRCAPTARISPV